MDIIYGIITVIITLILVEFLIFLIFPLLFTLFQSVIVLLKVFIFNKRCYKKIKKEDGSLWRMYWDFFNVLGTRNLKKSTDIMTIVNTPIYFIENLIWKHIFLVIVVLIIIIKYY